VELFCALLTGFFLWLFLYHWHHAALARAREIAGALLIEVPAAQQLAKTTREQRTVAIGASLLLAIAFVFLFPWSQIAALGLFSSDIMVACLALCLLQLAFPPFRKDAPLELRERGVVRRKQSYENYPGPLAFTPWEDIAGCKWYDGLPKHYVHTRVLLLDRSGLSAAEVEAITAVARRFVPMIDADGNVLAGPDSADAGLRRRGAGGLRFQFNLQSLMLLMVVVSCAASCYGIRYRRAQPQREAIAKLETFHPIIHEVGGDVWSLDFKACTMKPGDDDLTCLEKLRNLNSLDLDGLPISDAGLRHLYPLKTLTSVSLLNTQVTQKGVDDLKRALPNTRISWYPPTAPVVKPPVGGKK
jgi:hypothetical protein